MHFAPGPCQWRPSRCHALLSSCTPTLSSNPVNINHIFNFHLACLLTDRLLMIITGKYWCVHQIFDFWSCSFIAIANDRQMVMCNLPWCCSDSNMLTAFNFVMCVCVCMHAHISMHVCVRKCIVKVNKDAGSSFLILTQIYIHQTHTTASKSCLAVALNTKVSSFHFCQ